MWQPYTIHTWAVIGWMVVLAIVLLVAIVIMFDDQNPMP